MKFADDLTCFKEFDKNIENEEIIADLKDCQSRVHQWGRLNQVIFDSTKEHFVVLHNLDGEGEDFRFLGTMFDTSLRMESNIRGILAQARPKVKALLRSRRFYSTNDMIRQYKTHVLCRLELNSAGFYHASDTALDPLERLQDSFLQKLGLTREEGFLYYNLAPLTTRRDIAMLGLLFKCAFGLAHPDLQKLFPRSPGVTHGYTTRLQDGRHSSQLEEGRPGTHHSLLRRSAFGLTRVWNRLPQELIASGSVTSFQKQLTNLARTACRQTDFEWARLLSPRQALIRETVHFERLLRAS